MKSGQELIITAGVGSFSKSTAPKITIDGTSLEINSQGLVEYKTLVTKSGKYDKKVLINYYKPDGTRESLIKTINYEVSDCGNVPK